MEHKDVQWSCHFCCLSTRSGKFEKMQRQEKFFIIICVKASARTLHKTKGCLALRTESEFFLLYCCRFQELFSCVLSRFYFAAWFETVAQVIYTTERNFSFCHNKLLLIFSFHPFTRYRGCVSCRVFFEWMELLLFFSLNATAAAAAVFDDSTFAEWLSKENRLLLGRKASTIRIIHSPSLLKKLLFCYFLHKRFMKSSLTPQKEKDFCLLMMQQKIKAHTKKRAKTRRKLFSGGTNMTLTESKMFLW